MSGARVRALVAVSLIIALGAFAYAQLRRPPAQTQRSTLLLLTSLPLVFGEEFSIEGNGSPVLKALQSKYHVIPISLADPAELAKGRLLLMAQPRAQPLEDLVALDQWVRRGGRLLLLADPMLEWPSSLPLGDSTRPPPMFADTGLLAHWGLRLDAPDARGPKVTTIGGQKITTVSPGELSGGCAISMDRIAARCRIGEGSATIVADADFLDVGHLGQGGVQNVDALMAELAALH